MSMLVLVFALVLGVLASTASAQEQQPQPQPQPATTDPAPAPEPTSGGSEYGDEAADAPEGPMVPGDVAKIRNGVAYAPQAAPDAVKQIIWAGNEIVGMPYLYGGGHADFEDEGYDCSGTISYALHGADLLATPRDSNDFARFGGGGVGEWVTIFTNPDHAYMTVAGIRLDTSTGGSRRYKGAGPRWRDLRKSDKGYKRRHPIGL